MCDTTKDDFTYSEDELCNEWDNLNTTVLEQDQLDMSSTEPVDLALESINNRLSQVAKRF